MKVSTLRSAGIVLAAYLAAALLCALAHAADDYPNRPVTIVVPFPPGASNDFLARYEADVLQRALHGSFVVETKRALAARSASLTPRNPILTATTLLRTVGDHDTALRDEIRFV